MPSFLLMGCLQRLMDEVHVVTQQSSAYQRHWSSFQCLSRALATQTPVLGGDAFASCTALHNPCFPGNL